MAGGTSIVTLDQTALEAISRDIANDGLVSATNAPPSPNEELLPSADTESAAESE
jgi:hypothetical protein